jgi:addiction module HigA family antidote
MYNPPSPGELLKEFLGEHTITELADHIGVSRATISRLVNGRTAVTVDLSIRLGAALNLSPEFFSKAQLQFDMWAESQRERPNIPPLAA